MCIHENEFSPAFKKIAASMLSLFGLVAITLASRRGERDFSMFVTPNYEEGIKLAIHDLRTWHPDSPGPTEASAIRVYGTHTKWYDMYSWFEEGIDGRRMPDILDMDDDDPQSVYRHCVANGYVEGVTLADLDDTVDASVPSAEAIPAPPQPPAHA